MCKCATWLRCGSDSFHIVHIGESFLAAFTFISAGVMGMHYGCLQDIFGQCPTPFAVGDNETGKTTSARFFLSMVGRQTNGLARHLIEAEASFKCTSSTIPFVFDDPDTIADVKKIINNTFNGQVRSNTRNTMTPRTISMFPMNEDKANGVLDNFWYVPYMLK